MNINKRYVVLVSLTVALGSKHGMCTAFVEHVHTGDVLPTDQSRQNLSLCCRLAAPLNSFPLMP